MTPEESERSLRSALSRAKGSAKQRNRPFDLTIGYLSSLWTDQDARCAVSGLRFSNERHEEAHVKTPFAPSIDRKDSSKGYTVENIRLVTMAANFALNQWGDEVLRRLAQGIVQLERRDEEEWYQEQNRKLHEAESAAERMIGKKREHQKMVVAGLKRSITMGPSRLKGAAAAAHRTRSGES